MSDQSKEAIIELLRQKVILKQQVYEKTKDVFNSLRGLLSQLSSELAIKVKGLSGDMIVSYRDNGEFEAEFTIGDETLLFVIHSNIFTFDSTHSVWKSSGPAAKGILFPTSNPTSRLQFKRGRELRRRRR